MVEKVQSQKIQVGLIHCQLEDRSPIIHSFLAGEQRPPGPNPSPNNPPRQPTPGPSSGGRPSTSGGGGGGGNNWRGLEFKFTPGDKNSFFNNRTGLAILLGGAIAGYISYNNAVYKEITWKDFVSQHLLRGNVRDVRFNCSFTPLPIDSGAKIGSGQ